MGTCNMWTVSPVEAWSHGGWYAPTRALEVVGARLWVGGLDLGEERGRGGESSYRTGLFPMIVHPLPLM